MSILADNSSLSISIFYAFIAFYILIVPLVKILCELSCKFQQLQCTEGLTVFLKAIIFFIFLAHTTKVRLLGCVRQTQVCIYNVKMFIQKISLCLLQRIGLNILK